MGWESLGRGVRDRIETFSRTKKDSPSTSNLYPLLLDLNFTSLVDLILDSKYSSNTSKKMLLQILL